MNVQSKSGMTNLQNAGFPPFWTDKIPDFSSEFPGLFFIIFKVTSTFYQTKICTLTISCEEIINFSAIYQRKGFLSSLFLQFKGLNTK